MEIKSDEKSCPVSKFTEMLGGKWKLIIISKLRSRGKMRFGQIALKILTNYRAVESQEPFFIILKTKITCLSLFRKENSPP